LAKNEITPIYVVVLPSVLWCCWLGSRKGIRPVKNWVVGCWHGYLCGARCTLAYMAQLMPLPLTVSCCSKIQICFTFLVPAHPGSPGKRVYVFYCHSWLRVCWIGTIICAKTADPIEMLFGLWTLVGAWNHVLGGGCDTLWHVAIFGAPFLCDVVFRQILLKFFSTSCFVNCCTAGGWYRVPTVLVLKNEKHSGLQKSWIWLLILRSPDIWVGTLLILVMCLSDRFSRW